MSFGGQVTPLGTKILITLLACYVLQLIATSWIRVPVVGTLPLYSYFSDAFRPWQLLTYPLIQSKDPAGFLFLLLGFYFFGAPVERYFGTSRFVTFLLALVLIPGAVGAALSPILTGGPTIYLGFWGVEIALVAAFGWIQRGSTIMWNLVLPIPAVYITYFSIAVAVLQIVGRMSDGVYHLLAIGVTYAVVQRGVQVPDFRRKWLQLKQRNIQKKLTKLQVIDGGKAGKPPERPNGDPRKPTVH